MKNVTTTVANGTTAQMKAIEQAIRKVISGMGIAAKATTPRQKFKVSPLGKQHPDWLGKEVEYCGEVFKIIGANSTKINARVVLRAGKHIIKLAQSRMPTTAL